MIRSDPDTTPRAMLRAAARGSMAAMAMSGMRKLTGELGLLEQAPPDAIFGQHPPWPLSRVPDSMRPALTELAHWGYGAVGGAMFIQLPSRVRRHPWAGLIYGVATWGAFEAVVAPALGLDQARRLRLVDRAAILADHVVYGAIVAGSRWPQQV